MSDHPKRQVGAEKIEITPEVMDAEATVICRWQEGVEYDVNALAAEVLRSMLRTSPNYGQPVATARDSSLRSREPTC